MLDLVQEPFNVNRAALAAGIAALAEPGFVDHRRAQVAAARDLLSSELEAGGLRVHPSQSNFVLVELGADDEAVTRRADAARHPHPRRQRVRPSGLRARDGRTRGRDATDGGRDHRGGARCLSSSPTASPSCFSARAPRRSWASPRTACSTRRRLLGMRPIITRTERVAVNIADGFARATNGERFVPCVTQYGPGAEAAFAAVAQAFGDRSPILLLPSEHAVAVQGTGPGAAQRAGIRADHALRRHRQRRRARPRGIPARAERAARPAQRPRARDGRQRRAERPGGRRRLGREDVVAAADAGERRRCRADGERAARRSASGHPRRTGRALRRSDRRAGAPRRAHRQRRWPPRSTARARSPRTIRSRSARPGARDRPRSTASSPRPTSCSASGRASRARSTSRPCRPARRSGRSRTTAAISRAATTSRSAASATPASCCCQLLDAIGAARSERREATEARGGRRARGLHGAVARAPDLGGLAAQPLPRGLGADAASSTARAPS